MMFDMRLTVEAVGVAEFIVGKQLKTSHVIICQEQLVAIKMSVVWHFYMVAVEKATGAKGIPHTTPKFQIDIVVDTKIPFAVINITAQYIVNRLSVPKTERGILRTNANFSVGIFHIPPARPPLDSDS